MIYDDAARYSLTLYSFTLLLIVFVTRYLREEGKLQGYDVIICDSSDPVGPAQELFGQQFFKSMYESLSPSGILCTQCECQWIHLDLISDVLHITKNIFGNSKYAYTTIPSYPCGQIGFIVSSKDNLVNVNIPVRSVPNSMNLKYYSKKIHKASFILPEFSRKILIEEENKITLPK